MKRLFERVSIIGVGLLGGSIGLAAKKYNVAGSIAGIGRNEERLKRALDKGAVDEITTDLAAGVRDSELILLCLPVEKIIEFLPDVIAHCSEGTLINDVGSAKKKIVETGENLCKDKNIWFIGSHPLAGSHKTGVEHATPTLFKGATCFITVTEKTPEAQLHRIVGFWKKLHARPFILKPERHDYLIATTSHAVHLIAATLAKTVGSLEEDQNLLRLIVGSGFKDSTRIAAGDVDLWVEICRQNSKAILDALERFDIEMQELRHIISQGDFEQLRDFLSRACTLRRQLD